MFLVGLTGGIASGKSTVSKFLQDFGCTVVDADLIARAVMEPGEKAYLKTVEAFGNDILLENGRINREVLGDIIFRDSESRIKLNRMTHSEIRKKMLWEIFVAFLRGNRFVILDIPLLVESKIWAKFLRHLVVVNCSPSVQLSRLMERNNYSMEEAKIRVDSQFPLSEKCKLATKIIDNDGSIENTKKQAQDFYKELEKSWSLNLYEIGFLTVSISFVFIKLAVAYL